MGLLLAIDDPDALDSAAHLWRDEANPFSSAAWGFNRTATACMYGVQV